MISIDQSITDYHASSKWSGKIEDFKVSSSTLKYAKKSTRDFIHNITDVSEKKSHFDFGNAFELYLMSLVNGSDEFIKDVAVIPSHKWEKEVLNMRPTLVNVKSSKEYKKLYSDWVEANQGKYHILDKGVESFELMENMACSIVSNDLIKSALESTSYQVSLEWEDELTGLTCKTRPDLTRKGKNTIIDVKSSVDASPSAFARDSAKYDYPLQAFMQVEGSIKTGYYNRVDHYYWLVCEKSAPYHFAFYSFDMEELESIRPRYEQAMIKAKKGLDYLDLGIDIHDIPSYGELSDSEYGVINYNLPSWY